MPNAPGRTSRKGVLSSGSRRCVGMGQLDTCPVKLSHYWGCCKKCCLLTLSPAGIAFPRSPTGPFPLPRGSLVNLSFLGSGTFPLHPVQPSHTRMFFRRAGVAWDSKINESHSRFLPSWVRQRTLGNQSLRSRCVCEF